MTEQSTSRSLGKQALSRTTGENINWYALSTEGDLAVLPKSRIYVFFSLQFQF